MAIRDIFKVSRKTFINPTAWIDYRNLASGHRTIKSTLKLLFTPDKATREESFDQAVARLHISEKTLQQTASTYRRFAWFFLFFGFIAFFYSFYLLFRYTAITSWFLGLAVTALFFSQAFKYDFWSFQIRRRKLGVTFKEWQQNILGGKDTSS